MPAWAERLYRRSLVVLPRAFRDEAEAELVETFRQAYARAARRSLFARLQFWWQMAADLAVTTLAERRRQPGREPISFHAKDAMKLMSDLNLAARMLRKNRGYSLPAILTLALGIGATTAIFSVVNAVLLRPLPYRDPGRLVLVWQELRARSVPEFPFPIGDIPDLRTKGTLFEDVAALTTGRQTVTREAGQPEQVRTAFVGTNTLRLLGLQIIHGRDFQEDDGRPIPPPPPQQGAAAGGAAPGSPSSPAAGGATPTAPAATAQAVPVSAAPPPPPPAITVLSHEFWQRQYGGDPNAVGKTLELGGGQALIVGVLAPGAELLFPPRVNVERAPDLWIAGRFDFVNGSRTSGAVRVIGRLKPGVTLAQAQGQMEGLASELRSTYPVKKNAGVYINVVSMHATLVSDVRPAILALMGAVAFVMLIACANVASLLLAQASRRERDLAVRTALGASPGSLVRQLLAESLLLSAIGAAIGLGLARIGIVLLQRIGPATLPRLSAVGMDFTVLAFTVLVSLAAAVLFGLVPAVRASRPDIVSVLHRSGRALGLGAGRLRSGLVVVEVALCFVLLVGSGLMLRSMIALQRVNPGYDPDGVLTFYMPNIRAQGQEGRAAFVRQVHDAIAALPGVQSVAAANPLPLDGGTANMPWGTEGMDPAAFQQAQIHTVQPGYFETMKATVLEGRTFTPEDNTPEATRIVIDSVLRARAFPGQPAVGKRLLLRLSGQNPVPFEVIGVVAHQRHASLAADGREAVFFADGQRGFGAASRWVVRTSGDLLSLSTAIRPAIAGLDPRVAVSEIQPMSAFVDRAQAPTGFALVLTGVFAVIALVLAVIGLYGVLSTSVRQRTAEIGVRLAFGAERAAIFKLVVGRGLILAIVGIVIGAAAAAALTRGIESLLVGVGTTDPVTFIGIAVLFLAVAALACGLPAYRASRLDATAALRSE